MAITIIVAIVAVAVALLIAVPLTCKVAVNNKAKKDAEVVGTAENRARSIIDEALKTEETSVLCRSNHREIRTEGLTWSSTYPFLFPTKSFHLPQPKPQISSGHCQQQEETNLPSFSALSRNTLCSLFLHKFP